MSHNDDAFTSAFQLLIATVRDFHSQGRPCLGATLKPALYTRGNFTELVLGFRRFGDFLRAAQTAGYVQLRPTAGGDISVWPTTVPVEEPSAPTQNVATSVTPTPQMSLPFRTTAGSGVRVRQDLWNAFNSFSARWVYDPTSDVAFKDTDATGMWIAPGVQRPNLVQIPNGRERVVEWMRSFANTQDTEIGRQLLAALGSDAGPYQFNNLVRASDLLRAWSQFHIQQVVAAIDAWATTSGVQPKNVTTPRYSPLRPSALDRPPAPQFPVVMQTVQRPETSISDPVKTSQPVASPLTQRLETLIDHLIDDLIQLRGLLQVVGIKQP
jgi:hypothetical protein